MKHPRAVRSLMVAGTIGAVALHGLVPAAASSASDESCFVSAINSARSAAGAAPLTMQGDLLRISRAWSQTMATAGHLYHNNNITNLAPSNWQTLGENVGMGGDCNSIAQAFMNSPEHRKNILDPAFTTLGVGVVDAEDGTVWVTEDFMGTGTAVRVPATPRPAPSVTAPPRTVGDLKVTTPTPTPPLAPKPVVPAPKPVVPTASPSRTEPVTPTKPRPSTPAPSPSRTEPVTPRPTPTPVPTATPILDPVPPVAARPAPSAVSAAAPADHGHGVFSTIASLFSHLF